MAVILIFEPGLNAIQEQNRAVGRLCFATNAANAAASGDVLFKAVGAPSDENGAADLRYMLDVARSVGEQMKSPA